MATRDIFAIGIEVAILSTWVVRIDARVKLPFDAISNAISDTRLLKDDASRFLDNVNRKQYHGNGEEESDQEAKAMLNSIKRILELCLDRLKLIGDILEIARHFEEDGRHVPRPREHIRRTCKKGELWLPEKQLARATEMLVKDLRSYWMFATTGSLPPVRQAVGEDPCCLLDLMGLQLESIGAKTAMQPRLSAPSAYNTYLPNRQCSLHRCKLSGKRKKHELMLRTRVSRSRVIVARLSGPFYGRNLLKVLTISVRHRIPVDAGIMTACKSGDVSRVKHLLGKGLAGPNDMTPANDTPLSMAIKEGFKEVVQLLLEQGADPNITCGKFETSPIQMAATYEQLGIARLLLKSGADITYTSFRGWSILHHLFEKGRSIPNTEYFSMFIGQTSFDDTKDLEGWTALHRCAAFGTAEDVYLLHRMGASRFSDKYRTNSGRHPIHVAAQMNNIATLKVLMHFYTTLPATDHGFASNPCAVHLADTYGFTPLHHAVHGHAKETVGYLLQHGADPRASVRRPSGWHPKNHKGDVLTVEDFARMSGGEEFLGTLVEALQEAGHNVTTDGENMLWGVR